MPIIRKLFLYFGIIFMYLLFFVNTNARHESYPLTYFPGFSEARSDGTLYQNP